MNEKKRTKRWVVAAVLLGAAVLCALWAWHNTGIRPIPTENAHVGTISILTKKDGVQNRWSLSGDDLTPEMEEALFQCMGRYSMSKGTISTGNMEITDPYLHISIWVLPEEGPSYQVNLSSNEHYCWVTLDGKAHRISHGAALLEEVQALPWMAEAGITE